MSVFTFEDQFCVLVLSFYLIDCVMKYSFPAACVIIERMITLFEKSTMPTGSSS